MKNLQTFEDFLNEGSKNKPTNTWVSSDFKKLQSLGFKSTVKSVGSGGYFVALYDNKTNTYIVATDNSDNRYSIFSENDTKEIILTSHSMRF